MTINRPSSIKGTIAKALIPITLVFAAVMQGVGTYQDAQKDHDTEDSIAHVTAENERATYAELVAEAYIDFQKNRGHRFTDEQNDTLRKLITAYENTEITFEATSDYVTVKYDANAATYVKQRINAYVLNNGLTIEKACSRGIQDLQHKIAKDKHIPKHQRAVSPDYVIEAHIRATMFNNEFTLTPAQKFALAAHQTLHGQSDTYLDYYTEQVLDGPKAYIIERADVLTYAEQMKPRSVAMPTVPSI